MRAGPFSIVLIVVMCGLCGAACSDNGGAGPADAGQGQLVDALPGACLAPLDDYCDGECPTFDDAVAELVGVPAPCVAAESGDCGPWRYVLFSGGFSGYMAWFTATGSGTLVAAFEFSDTNSFCDRSSFSRTFGPTMDCELHPTARYGCNP